MKSKFLNKTITYTGKQLQSHFAYKQFGITGDSIIGFRGACDIAIEHMLDIEDKRSGNKISSMDMLHFIVEHHDTDIEKSVLRQWLLASIAGDILRNTAEDSAVTRYGSDLFDGDAKVSISIATVTPISSLIHFGVNISSDNTPVKTKGLNDYGLEPSSFAQSVMDRYVREIEMIHKACHKVQWAG